MTLSVYHTNECVVYRSLEWYMSTAVICRIPGSENLSGLIKCLSLKFNGIFTKKTYYDMFLIANGTVKL